MNRNRWGEGTVCVEADGRPVMAGTPPPGRAGVRQDALHLALRTWPCRVTQGLASSVDTHRAVCSILPNSLQSKDTAALQAPVSLESSRQEYWSG